MRGGFCAVGRYSDNWLAIVIILMTPAEMTDREFEIDYNIAFIFVYTVGYLELAIGHFRRSL